MIAAQPGTCQVRKPTIHRQSSRATPCGSRARTPLSPLPSAPPASQAALPSCDRKVLFPRQRSRRKHATASDSQNPPTVDLERSAVVDGLAPSSGDVFLGSMAAFRCAVCPSPSWAWGYHVKERPDACPPVARCGSARGSHRREGALWRLDGNSVGTASAAGVRPFWPSGHLPLCGSRRLCQQLHTCTKAILPYLTI